MQTVFQKSWTNKQNVAENSFIIKLTSFDQIWRKIVSSGKYRRFTITVIIFWRLARLKKQRWRNKFLHRQLGVFSGFKLAVIEIPRHVRRRGEKEGGAWGLCRYSFMLETSYWLWDFSIQFTGNSSAQLFTQPWTSQLSQTRHSWHSEELEQAIRQTCCLIPSQLFYLGLALENISVEGLLIRSMWWCGWVYGTNFKKGVMFNLLT